MSYPQQPISGHTDRTLQTFSGITEYFCLLILSVVSRKIMNFMLQYSQNSKAEVIHWLNAFFNMPFKSVKNPLTLLSLHFEICEQADIVIFQI